MLELLHGNALTHDNHSNCWIGTDSPENYSDNIVESTFRAKWLDRRISYILNSQGYRCPEWEKIDWENSILMFGDSWVLGIGVPVSETLCNQLEAIIKIPVINLGVGGSSNLFSLYNMTLVKEAGIKPKGVINLETTPERTLTFQKKTLGAPGPLHWGSWVSENMYYKKFWLKYEDNYIRHDEYIRMTKKHLWADNKYLNYNPNTNLPKREKDYARDNMHPSGATYKLYAEQMAKDWWALNV